MAASHLLSLPPQVFCGRYVNEHMVTHGVEAEHPVVLSFSDLSVWCYLCENYLHNQVTVGRRTQTRPVALNGSKCDV